MRISWISLALAAAIASASGAIAASTNLRGMMHDWKAQARMTSDMLSGRARFDPATVRGILTRYADDAGRIAALVPGTSAEARDIKLRFLSFQTEARAALGNLNHPQALQSDFSRVLSSCRSCHGVYKD